jgi:hypothetical protein
MLGWAFIHGGSAVVIEAPSMQDALKEYLSDWYPDVMDLQIVPVTGHSGYNI